MRKPQSSTKQAEVEMEVELKRGAWTLEEDEILSEYVKMAGEGNWRLLPKKAGLLRCGKSCRLRWMNYLRPSVKHGNISPAEEDLIIRLHRLLGNRWSLIAGRIPGRTDNEVKNYWNTHLKKMLIIQGLDPKTHKPLIINPNPNENPAITVDAPMESRVPDTNHGVTSISDPDCMMGTEIRRAISQQDDHGNEHAHNEKPAIVVDALMETRVPDTNHYATLISDQDFTIETEIGPAISQQDDHGNERAHNENPAIIVDALMESRVPDTNHDATLIYVQDFTTETEILYAITQQDDHGNEHAHNEAPEDTNQLGFAHPGGVHVIGDNKNEDVDTNQHMGDELVNQDEVISNQDLEFFDVPFSPLRVDDWGELL